MRFPLTWMLLFFFAVGGDVREMIWMETDARIENDCLVTLLALEAQMGELDGTCVALPAGIDPLSLGDVVFVPIGD